MYNEHLLQPGIVGEMYAVGGVYWVREGWQDVDIGDVGMAEHGLKDKHDGSVPARIPIWLTTNHWGGD